MATHYGYAYYGSTYYGLTYYGSTYTTRRLVLAAAADPGRRVL